MPILDPTCDRSYLLGSLIQQCDACHWALSGHHAEFAECPRCGKPLDHPAAIEFGGLSLAWLGKHCRAYDSEGGSVTLYEADQPDIIAFLCRHVRDWRPSDPHPRTVHLERRAWEPEFVDQLQFRRRGEVT
ncbi:MAG TPA: hypothetical protein PLX09_02645 [Xanthomonadaceae bacterium]|nr:hypothetical protein [Xanthomonadaceae bacterium]